MERQRRARYQEGAVAPERALSQFCRQHFGSRPKGVRPAQSRRKQNYNSGKEKKHRLHAVPLTRWCKFSRMALATPLPMRRERKRVQVRAWRQAAEVDRAARKKQQRRQLQPPSCEGQRRHRLHQLEHGARGADGEHLQQRAWSMCRLLGPKAHNDLCSLSTATTVAHMTAHQLCTPTPTQEGGNAEGIPAPLRWGSQG